MSHSFFGGIVFPARVERKAPAASRPLEEFTPSLLVLSMRQGFGGECEPAVSPGDQVLVGSVVGRSPDGFERLSCVVRVIQSDHSLQIPSSD